MKSSRGGTIFLIQIMMHAVLSLPPPCYEDEYQTGQECCPVCPPGTRVNKHCTEIRRRSCEPCDEGTYMNKYTEATQCFSCRTCASAHGLLALQPCSSVSDGVCGARPGFFCQRVSEGGSCEAAQKHSSCSPGQRVKEPGTSSADTVCEDCPEETFSPQGTSCTAWTRCSEAEVVVRAGNRTEDVLCGRALRSHYGIIASFIVIWSVILVVVYRLLRQPDPQGSPR